MADPPHRLTRIQCLVQHGVAAGLEHDFAQRRGKKFARILVHADDFFRRVVHQSHLLGGIVLRPLFEFGPALDDIRTEVAVGEFEIPAYVQSGRQASRAPKF